MTRLIWSAILLCIMVGGGWTIYAGAQDLMTEVKQIDDSADPRYQFIEHYYTNSNGFKYEVFLRLDRETGQTWRFHASQPTWSPIGEPAGEILPSEPGINRYELLSHEYRDGYGQQQELFLRVDDCNGASWKYRGMADAWESIAVQGGGQDNPASQQVASQPDDDAALVEAAAP